MGAKMVTMLKPAGPQRHAIVKHAYPTSAKKGKIGKMVNAKTCRVAGSGKNVKAGRGVCILPNYEGVLIYNPFSGNG